MNKSELVDALQKLSLETKEIVVALKEHYPDDEMSEQLAGAAMMMLNWADGIIDKELENDR